MKKCFKNTLKEQTLFTQTGGFFFYGPSLGEITEWLGKSRVMQDYKFIMRLTWISHYYFSDNVLNKTAVHLDNLQKRRSGCRPRHQTCGCFYCFWGEKRGCEMQNELQMSRQEKKTSRFNTITHLKTQQCNDGVGFMCLVLRSHDCEFPGSSVNLVLPVSWRRRESSWSFSHS